MLTPARIESMLKPLEETTRSLSLAADARRQGRPVDLDPDRLIALVDATAEAIARELGPEVLKDLAVAADRTRGMLSRRLSGESFPTAAILAELAQLRQGLAALYGATPR